MNTIVRQIENFLIVKAEQQGNNQDEEMKEDFIPSRMINQA